MMDQAAYVWYLELRADHALELLQAWQNQLNTAPSCLSAYVLHAPDQNHLYLLQSTWSVRPNPALWNFTVSSPSKLSSWIFEVVP